MNKFLAHHINPNAGAGVANPFAEPSMEQMVDMIMPGEFPGTLEEFNQKYGDNRPTFMEIPVIPFDPNKKNNSKEDDLSFLKAFTKSRMG